MHLENFLKDYTIEDFTCDLCNNVLSHFPIYLTSDCQNVCGRCTPPPGNLYFRNRIYENISQTVKFPCRFKNQGCLETLLPEKVPDHETCCKFRTIQCSLLECKWEGACPNYFQHCKHAHKEMFLKDKESFEMDLSTSFHITKLLEKENLVFVGEVIFDETKLQVALYYPRHEIDADKKYLCEFCLQTETNELLVRFKTTSFNDRSFTDLYSDFRKNRLLSCYISFKDETTQTQISTDDKERETSKELNTEFLSLLKCSSCKMFALPPIYHCSIAITSVLCSNCKYNGLKSSQYRNITLDNLASLLNYPCKYNESGCKFVGIPCEIEKHFRICQYRLITCPLLNTTTKNCEWNGYRKDIEKHIHIQHRSSIRDCAQEANNLTFKKSPRIYLLLDRGDGRLFFVEYMMESKRYCWRIQMIPKEKDEIFQYQMEIYHPNLPHKVLISKPCSELVMQPRGETSDYDYVNIDQIGENARFTIRIL